MAVLTIELLLLFGWIPDLGLVFLGLAINTNVLLSAIVIVSLYLSCLLRQYFQIFIQPCESSSVPDSIMSYLKSIKKGSSIIVINFTWFIMDYFSSFNSSCIDIYQYLLIHLRKVHLIKALGSIAEDITEANEEVARLTTEFTKEQLSEVEDAFETAIELNVRSNQNNFGISFPQNVIENPEIIFNNNNTEYTEILPNMLEDLLMIL